MKNDMTKYVEKAKELGAYNAKIISTDTIKTGAWTILKCRYGCKNYNTSYCCPPKTPSYKETQNIIDCYSTGLIVQSKSDLVATTKIINKLENEIFLSGYYKAFGFGAGPCRLCEKCNMEHCAHPQEARPSMEACGIDVFATVRESGFPIEVLKGEKSESKNELNCYGLILIE
ncbi:DUF2284 domain-containing protein [Clostridium sp. 001]|uniref:DUF2284 domain-containing protein n=1 Tax=Clostridium sp. 001 TaxID=1970093 RepID=UPI001C2C37A8|nr:DUF2284 domain-containing protein [Clostridium sp. 001]QXE17381.1 hypothetical protein B5S50_00140 [Clostridium sp. 001]QXE21147.1 hypothetical protein B5S50_21095 [Clostridium sp. 001]